MRIGQYNFALSTHTKLTMSASEVVYDGLIRVFGGGRISQYIEDLVRPHVLGMAIEEGYRAMAADVARERDAVEWVDALSQDMAFNIFNRKVNTLTRLTAQEQKQGRS